MNNNVNPEIVEAYKSYLDDEDWHYTYDAEKGFFRFGMNLRGKLKVVQYMVFVKEDDFTVYAISPISADAKNPKQIREMAEFVCRANYGLRDGNFELDVNDGELRYKSYVNCEEFLPTVERIRRSIYIPAAMFDKYSGGILQVVMNNVPARDAIKMCEESRIASELLAAAASDDDDDDDDEIFDADDDDEAEDQDDEEAESASMRELLKLLRERMNAREENPDSEDDPE